MRDTNSLEETKRKNKLFEKKDKLRREKISKYTRKEKENLGKPSRNQVKILNEYGDEIKDEEN